MIAPSDLQSMGYAIPAAIGAAVTGRFRSIVAVVGDGGFQMSAGSLALAVRERIPLTVVVFNDGALSQIRCQQLLECGHEFATRLGSFDYRAYAQAVGARYALLDGNMHASLQQAVESQQANLVEVRLTDSRSLRWLASRARMVESVKRTLGPRAIARLRRILRRTRNRMT
jgi:acetolactate synthase-1/2/3 large subunit